METLVIEDTKSAIKSHFSRAEWLQQGDALLRDAMAGDWNIGDWAASTPAEYSLAEVREILEEAATRTGYDLNTLRQKRRVSERIPPELRERGVNLPWYGFAQISKLAVHGENGEDEDATLALRAEFVDKFAAQPDARVEDIKVAVRAKLGKSAASEMKTVSFKLTAEDFARLEAAVADDPEHEDLKNYVCALVLNALKAYEAGL
jgi:hypothetical protein